MRAVLDSRGPFRDELLGCQRVGSGQVQCSIKSTYTGSGPTYYGATYYARDTAAYARIGGASSPHAPPSTGGT
ncbi:hypothetical protein [Deinococcus cavernae]|uniref:hypothetical protein n=1 Tax=Deinococcus cavernae TaxID=2320857 RepID=UPI0011C210C6|nr:hypothetical protein [Deinococcus cavernae]